MYTFISLELVAEGAVRLLLLEVVDSLVMPQAAHSRLDSSCSERGAFCHFRIDLRMARACMRGKSRCFCGGGRFTMVCMYSTIAGFAQSAKREIKLFYKGSSGSFSC